MSSNIYKYININLYILTYIMILHNTLAVKYNINVVYINLINVIK